MQLSSGSSEEDKRKRRTNIPGRHWSIYLAVLLSLPVLYLVAAFVLVPSQWALHHTRNTYLANMGYGDTLHNTKCDVLIYGDSSAMVGVDPALLQANTGLSACDIAEFEGMTTVFGTELVDNFLRNNQRPRYIVFIFAPEDLRPQTGWTGPQRMEAIIYAMRTRRNLHTLGLLLRHPAEMFGALETGLRILLADLRRPPLSAKSRHLRADHNGWLPVYEQPATACYEPLELTSVDANWVNGLRQRYGADGTRVMVLTMPEPTCDSTFDLYAPAVSGVTDNALEIYPLPLYSKVGRLHLVGAGVTRFTTEIGERIRLLNSPSQQH
jgi:hypothetical protein